MAVAPFIGERQSVRFRQQTEERLSPKRRLANELFELDQLERIRPRSCGCSGGGTRTPGAARYPHLSHWQRGTGRGDARHVANLYGVAGWLVFGAAFVGVIALVVVRAAHGQAGRVRWCSRS